MTMLEERSSTTDGHRRVGFFTDTTLCIGCKACEVACREWNEVPDPTPRLSGRSYDNTLHLGADAWRHVAFIEQRVPLHPGSNGHGPAVGEDHDGRVRWLMSSDVCKHCTHAACLDVCPTGALVRTEFETVIIQSDICNGCGYCVSACPFGVIDQRVEDGRVWKCTLCYDRLRSDLTPACAQACPTASIQFGPLDELRRHANQRVAELHDAGVGEARLYGADDTDGVGGMGAFFLLLDEPEVYGLPPDPVVTMRDLPGMWRSAATAAAALVGTVAAVALSSVFGRRR